MLTLLAVSFGVLLWVGGEIHRQMRPIPARVVSSTGETVYTRADIEQGRQVWQSIGGHPLVWICGHGRDEAPDWTADWLHRDAVAWLELEAQRVRGQPWSALAADAQAALQIALSLV